jgi:hypothetical protein
LKPPGKSPAPICDFPSAATAIGSFHSSFGGGSLNCIFSANCSVFTGSGTVSLSEDSLIRNDDVVYLGDEMATKERDVGAIKKLLVVVANERSNMTIIDNMMIFRPIVIKYLYFYSQEIKQEFFIFGLYDTTVNMLEV